MRTMGNMHACRRRMEMDKKVDSTIIERDGKHYLVIDVSNDDVVRDLWHRMHVTESDIKRMYSGRNLDFPERKHTSPIWEVLNSNARKRGIRE